MNIKQIYKAYNINYNRNQSYLCLANKIKNKICHSQNDLDE